MSEAICGDGKRCPTPGHCLSVNKCQRPKPPLVERLRVEAEDGIAESLLLEAAARIEALEAEVKKYMVMCLSAQEIALERGWALLGVKPDPSRLAQWDAAIGPCGECGYVTGHDVECGKR